MASLMATLARILIATYFHALWVFIVFAAQVCLRLTGLEAPVNAACNVVLGLCPGSVQRMVAALTELYQDSGRDWSPDCAVADVTDTTESGASEAYSSCSLATDYTVGSHQSEDGLSAQDSEPRAKRVPGIGPAPASPVSPLEANGALDQQEYRVLLGKGAFGQVFLDGNEAVKQQVCATDASRAKVMKEYECMHTCSHRSSNVVAPISIEFFKGVAQTRMELCKGSVQDWIDQLDQSQSPTSVREVFARRFLKQASKGLHYIHKAGFVHADIKPANILVARKANLETAPRGTFKISDFGLAFAAEEGGQLKSRMGTPEFAAPEMWAFKPRSSAGYNTLVELTPGCAIDVYSLGMTF